jgi:hypothetical protein
MQPGLGSVFNMKIKYKNTENVNEFIIEDIGEENPDTLIYCKNLKELLETKTANVEDSKIWIEIENDFILSGI